MRKLIAPLALLLLAGCANAQNKQIPLSYWLENPLFTERYAADMVDAMVELEIQEDVILADSGKKSTVDETRRHWLEKAKDAREAQRKGPMGSFIPSGTFAKGSALFVNDTLYFGSTFESVPSPSVHVYLSKAVDPRDVPFPDPTALDLGTLLTPYGAQRYDVPKVEEPLTYRAVVLYDTKLERVLSFAQISM